MTISTLLTSPGWTVWPLPMRIQSFAPEIRVPKTGGGNQQQHTDRPDDVAVALQHVVSRHEEHDGRRRPAAPTPTQMRLVLARARRRRGRADEADRDEDRDDREQERVGEREPPADEEVQSTEQPTIARMPGSGVAVRLAGLRADDREQANRHRRGPRAGERELAQASEPHEISGSPVAPKQSRPRAASPRLDPSADRFRDRRLGGPDGRAPRRRPRPLPEGRDAGAELEREAVVRSRPDPAVVRRRSSSASRPRARPRRRPPRSSTESESGAESARDGARGGAQPAQAPRSRRLVRFPAARAQAGVCPRTVTGSALQHGMGRRVAGLRPLARERSAWSTDADAREDDSDVVVPPASFAAAVSAPAATSRSSSRSMISVDRRVRRRVRSARLSRAASGHRAGPRHLDGRHERPARPRALG